MVEVIRIGFEAILSAVKTVVQLVGVGPILTFLGIVSAWVFPLLREQRQRERQDGITVRGLLLYLEVLESKINSIVKAYEDLHAANDRLRDIRNQQGAPIRNVDNDQKVVTQKATVDKLMYYTPAPGSFETDNLKNHDSIERLFVSSELSNTNQRGALLAFIKYFKDSKQMVSVEDYQRYKEQLAAVLNCLRTTKSENRTTGQESRL